MNKIIAILGGIGFGAAVMYLLDPKDGNRRRALIRDKAFSLSNKAQKTVKGKAEDLKNRTQGLLHETKSMLTEKGQSSGKNQTATGQTA